MNQGFTWIPVFKAIAQWLRDYEHRQPELVNILKRCGISAGLDDRDAGGKIEPLQVMDPFTFFCLFTKYGEQRRAQLFAGLLQQIGLDIPAPTDFHGVPTSNAQRVWMFPFKETREDWMVTTLWQLFDQVLTDRVDDALFQRALTIFGVGFTKLTVVFFYVAPDNYFPVDGQTRSWLDAQGIALPEQNFSAYQATIAAVRERSEAPFAEISHRAWLDNQGGSSNGAFDSAAAMRQLHARYPGAYTGSARIATYRTGSGRALALDPTRKTVELFLHARPPSSVSEQITEYLPNQAPNHHLATHSSWLANGQQAYLVRVESPDELEALCDWYDNDGESTTVSLSGNKIAMTTEPLNQILFGPPGTGKTFATIDRALAILRPGFSGSREQMKAAFDTLVADEQIRFVTFHQSFSYEDFVEGIRATTNDETRWVEYRIEPGVFKQVCESASSAARVASEVGVSNGARIWKISIDGTGPSATREHGFRNGEARIGWGEVGDLTHEDLDESSGYLAFGSNDRSTMKSFSREITPGDVLLCIASAAEVQAVGVVQGPYRFEAEVPPEVHGDFRNVLPVHWLATGLKLDLRQLNGGTRFTLKTVYELSRFSWPDLAEELSAKGIALEGAQRVPAAPAKDHVLIIDEINRGNVSRIFGELITLIEPSKRAGEAEQLKVVLPYSKKPFQVPNNVYLIGTMNTADRSLASLDIALRRRFAFVEMAPDPAQLEGRVVAGVPLRRLLEVMNQRIEALLDRDHAIGHAFFIGLRSGDPLERLATVFRNQIIPLLQEYFFEDWERVHWVLNDHRKTAANQFVQSCPQDANLFGPKAAGVPERVLWRLNDEAFEHSESFAGIIDASND